MFILIPCNIFKLFLVLLSKFQSLEFNLEDINKIIDNQERERRADEINDDEPKPFQPTTAKSEFIIPSTPLKGLNQRRHKRAPVNQITFSSSEEENLIYKKINIKDEKYRSLYKEHNLDESVEKIEEKVDETEKVTEKVTEIVNEDPINEPKDDDKKQEGTKFEDKEETEISSS